MKDIELAYQGRIHRVPNRWEGMSSENYISLVADLLHMAGGQLSAGEVRINHLLRLMGWDKRKFRTEEQIANLVAISEQLTFLFQINYPDNNAALDGVSGEAYERCRRVDPYRLQLPIARVLRRLDYRYVVDLCFCAQLLPSVRVKEHDYKGYTVKTPCPRSCSRLSRSIFRRSTAICSIRPRSRYSPSSSPSPLALSLPMPSMHSMTCRKTGWATPLKLNR